MVALALRSLCAPFREVLPGEGRAAPALRIQSGTITALMSSCMVIPLSFAIFLNWAYISGSRDCINLVAVDHPHIQYTATLGYNPVEYSRIRFRMLPSIVGQARNAAYPSATAPSTTSPRPHRCSPF